MLNKIYVDVGCRHNPGPFEIQGMDEHGNRVFYFEFENGSNNIGEYLAIYVGLSYAEEVWTDSTIALSWCRKGCRTGVPCDKYTIESIQEADQFFKSNFGIMKRVKFWRTSQMGENPADFGRKI